MVRKTRRKSSEAQRPASRSSAALSEYQRKRDFSITAEPRPEAGRATRIPTFVVHEHHARRLHYDLRLESDGVLKSWAVPKEPSSDPSVRRLAVHVEDHPLKYGSFRGDIPAGQYGAGHVEIWDKGTYRNVLPGSKPNESITAAIAAGKVEVELDGEKLKGGYVLVRSGPRGDKENWLLIKRKDAFASTAGDSPASEKAASSIPRGADGRKVAAPVPAKRPSNETPVSSEAPAQLEFTHPDKVMFPGPGYTKADLLVYYGKIADRLLPYLKDRPITLERFPDGVAADAPRFWQKNTPAYYPKWIPRLSLPTETRKPVDYLLINDPQTLLYLVNQGAITFHTFLSRAADLDRPDYVLFDFDPGEARFADVVKIAKTLHQILSNQGIHSYVKTSGKSGLHVLAPWEQPGGYTEARGWAMGNAQKVVDAHTDLATIERSKDRRRGRIYVDVMQNHRGHHVVPPYVVRATPDATVSTPLEWRELTARLDPGRFTIGTLFSRLAKQKADPMLPLVSPHD